MDSAPDPTERDETSVPIETAGPGEPGGQSAAASPPLGKWLLIYSLLRVGLLVVLAAGLSLLMPLILALLFAILLALPLSWVIFGGVRRRVNVAMAVSTAQRRSERDRLRSALDGREQR